MDTSQFHIFTLQKPFLASEFIPQRNQIDSTNMGESESRLEKKKKKKETYLYLRHCDRTLLRQPTRVDKCLVTVLVLDLVLPCLQRKGHIQTYRAILHLNEKTQELYFQYSF